MGKLGANETFSDSNVNTSQQSVNNIGISSENCVAPSQSGQRSRLTSNATVRSSVGVDIIGRPIVWTKQATLKRGGNLLYIPQKLDLPMGQPISHISSANNLSNQGIIGNKNSSNVPLNPYASNSILPQGTASSTNLSGVSTVSHTPSSEKSSHREILNKLGTPAPYRRTSSAGQTSQWPASQLRDTHLQIESQNQSLDLIQLKKRKSMNTSHKQSDAASIFSLPYHEIIQKIGHPLRGPVLMEFSVHYFFFLLILFVAWKTSWAPQIRFYLTVIYAFLSFLVLSTARVVLSRFPNSFIPFYISFIPLGLILYISREAHQLVMVLWFISFLIILLQSGHPRLSINLLYFCAIYFLVYLGSIFTMAVTYHTDCQILSCGVQLATPILPMQEVVIIVDCLFIIVIFGFLERFIKMNASILLDRDNYMKNLYIANVDLKRQLRKVKTENEVDLEAPLSRAAQILNEVKNTQDLEEGIAGEIDFIIGLLSSDKLFQPDLFQNSNDTDVHVWLKDMLLTDKGSVQPAKVLLQHLGSSIYNDLALFKNSLDVVGRNAFALLSMSCETPEFDVFDLEVVTSGHALYYMGWYLFRKHGFSDTLNMDEFKFRNWLLKIEAGYRRSNVYHNSTHATDVTHSMNYFCTRTQIQSLLKVEDKIAVLIAPIIHDYMHPGVNNAFLMATSNALALRYNDQSILENFHCASLFEMVELDDIDIFSPLTAEQRKSVRETIMSMVLATDMAFHFDWIGKFKSKLGGSGFNFETKSDKRMVLNIAIKCADVSNPTKPQLISRRWTQLIMEEFFRQGDEEKNRGIPISTFMNRETTDIPKCQIGFIDFIVYPLYEAWSSYLKEDVEIHMRNIQSNKAFWKSCTENPNLGSPVQLVVYTVSPPPSLGPHERNSIVPTSQKKESSSPSGEESQNMISSSKRSPITIAVTDNALQQTEIGQIEHANHAGSTRMKQASTLPPVLAMGGHQLESGFLQPTPMPVQSIKPALIYQERPSIFTSAHSLGKNTLPPVEFNLKGTREELHSLLDHCPLPQRPNNTIIMDIATPGAATLDCPVAPYKFSETLEPSTASPPEKGTDNQKPQ
ncbi:hypothetical protein BASA60_004150 [Batrachochytrium salamandrivorans]|nr:hypothetical protein BASA60_004150 [Batrachochytrium salamandrivorans]